MKKTNKMEAKLKKEFEKRYYDKNTASGLNQKFPFLNFIRMVDDIRDNFFPQALQAEREKVIGEIEKYVDEFIALQENKEGITEEDVLSLQMGVEAFLMSFKLNQQGEK